MRLWLISHLVVLLIIANGTPALLGLVLGPRWNRPLDNNRQFPDNRPLLGPSKTFRGLFSAIVVTGLLAPLFELSMLEGASFALLAMLGDICSSFIKRRLGFASSRSVPLLDQLPESILPLWGLQTVLGASGSEMALAVAIFIVIDLLLSGRLKALRDN
jgi:CDP-2,3-bis-(O-geranylgeranyl)-sn-glycerol synthase